MPCLQRTKLMNIVGGLIDKSNKYNKWNKYKTNENSWAAGQSNGASSGSVYHCAKIWLQIQNTKTN